MPEIDPEYLKHQYLYVPWVEGKDSDVPWVSRSRFA